MLARGDGAAWGVVGEFAADGQRSAKRQATADPDVAKALADGQKIALVAVPLSSWQPTTVALEQRAPVIRGL